MDGEGRLHSFFVIRVAAFARELRALRSIQFRECASSDVALFERLSSGKWFEQPSPNDLESFLGCCWSPGRFETAYHISQSVQCFAAAYASDFHIIYLRVWRSLSVGRGKRNYEQAVPGKLGRFGQCLRERELSLETSTRQVALVMELSSVRHPFIHQHETWSVLLEQLAQKIARARGSLVVGLYPRKCLLAA